MKKVLNAQGEPIVLNARESKIANYIQRQVNNVGYEVDITTLTTIMKSIVEQKFFEIPFAEYFPVKAGEGAWSTNLVTYRSFSLGDDFATGVINAGANNSRLSGGDIQLDSVSVKVFNWAKELTWSLFDLQFASKSGNWDVVTALEKSRKKNWDLGLQKLGFIGLTTDQTSCPGLLSQSDVTTDTTTVTKFLKDMSAAEFNAVLTNLYQEYRSNAAYSAKPTHFIIPEIDYNGLASQFSSTYPMLTKLEALRRVLEDLTMNKSFKVLPLAYANKAIHGTSNIYTMLNYDEDSVRMDIPVNYTNTLANSINNFSFQNVGYGQFSGVKAYRPKEMIYFKHAL